MKIGDRVVAVKEIQLYDPNTFILDLLVTPGHSGFIYKDVTKTMPNGSDYRMLAVKFDDSEFIHLTAADKASETIKLA